MARVKDQKKVAWYKAMRKRVAGITDSELSARWKVIKAERETKNTPKATLITPTVGTIVSAPIVN